ncbi:Phosphoglucomutase/phosphomannomutase alpha/beta/alpha domain I family protein [Cryptosporidium meleagridis]|uniref:phosphoglucomutase (alpha-D-glucose-1,6-bisphosphate-dependent) n=1 Tax=Cryptosporidium meleagridis TaxID=93969 RepID=A0A2P4YZD1_9CRYT|nr:Phosphoglucomutase/phosphomannomutase alpha/beta/alpha domain I family protein [Cryptosporidium meleagridis]
MITILNVFFLLLLVSQYVNAKESVRNSRYLQKISLIEPADDQARADISQEIQTNQERTLIKKKVSVLTRKITETETTETYYYSDNGLDTWIPNENENLLDMLIQEVQVSPYLDQKPGTSGLRKKTRVFMEGTYLANFIESYFQSFPPEDFEGATLLVAGDGRFFLPEAIQTISEIAAAHKVRRIWTGVNGLCSTPAGSAIIREREGGIAVGGILLTASHNPGGIDEDFGVKFNGKNGGPAQDSVTDTIFEITKKLTSYKKISLPKIDLSKIGVQELIPNQFTVEVIDTSEDWLKLMKKIFDFQKIQSLLNRKDFKMVFDSMHGVAGQYARKLFLEEFGLPESSMLHLESKPDFGGLHPDPNLTYAKDLVEIMKVESPEKVDKNTPDFGAAGDGDCDRNMILGKGFFVTPSDSVAIIASYAKEAIPYFSKGLVGVSRSMPTSTSLNNVAERLGIPCYEVPTGWKYFGNLMDAKMINICGEESFGTGSDHIREKDGLWAVLAWLSILAYKNPDPTKPLVSVEDITREFWKTYGRNYYTRFDYESVESEKADQFFKHLNSLLEDSQKLRNSLRSSGLKVKFMDNFTYNDPVDGSVSKNQGVRIIFTDNSRIVFRLSGTGSVGATIRIYMEKTVKNPQEFEKTAQQALSHLIEIVEKKIKLKEITGRSKPTVIT